MRIDHAAVYPAARRAMLEVEKAVHAGGVDPLLLEPLNIRASQLNGCAHLGLPSERSAGAAGADRTPGRMSARRSASVPQRECTQVHDV